LRNAVHFLLLAFLFIAVSYGCDGNAGVNAPNGGGGDAAVNETQYEADVWNIVNEERAKLGYDSLTRDPELDAVAFAHSEAMRNEGRIFHEGGPDGTLSGRLGTAGIIYTTAGENVAYGQSTPESVMNAWMNSPNHRANILNPVFTHVGIGLATPGNYWTQVFIQKSASR
jgi:uncharacterized protein YkwD